MNIAYEDAGSFRDRVQTERFFFALSLATFPQVLRLPEFNKRLPEFNKRLPEFNKRLPDKVAPNFPQKLKHGL